MKKVKMQLLKIALTLALITGGLSTALLASASQELMLSGTEKLKAQVSSSKINRITFGSGHFSRIVGDSSKYHVIIDELGANMFLTSKVPAGSSFEISIVNASGLVADLILDVKDMPGQIINIHDEPAYNSTNLNSNTNLNSYSHPSLNTYITANVSKRANEREIANMLKNMIADEQGKYYVKAVKRLLKSNHSNLDNDISIVQDRTYRFGSLTGARLVVKNIKTNKAEVIKLQEHDFKDVFESVKAVSIGNKTLAKNNVSHVWVITEDVKEMGAIK